MSSEFTPGLDISTIARACHGDHFAVLRFTLERGFDHFVNLNGWAKLEPKELSNFAYSASRRDIDYVCFLTKTVRPLKGGLLQYNAPLSVRFKDIFLSHEATEEVYAIAAKARRSSFTEPKSNPTPKPRVSAEVVGAILGAAKTYIRENEGLPKLKNGNSWNVKALSSLLCEQPEKFWRGRGYLKDELPKPSTIERVLSENRASLPRLSGVKSK